MALARRANPDDDAVGLAEDRQRLAQAKVLRCRGNGNAPAERLDKLRAFWERIATPALPFVVAALSAWANHGGNARA